MPRLFYGYVILGLCFLNMIFVRGVAGSFSVFYVALLEDFHWSHGVGASIVSINSLVYALVSPLVGWAFDRLGPRRLFQGAAVLVALAFVLASRVHSLALFLVVYGMVGGLGLARTNASATSTAAPWNSRRGPRRSKAQPTRDRKSVV